jgi:hypothetical protein
MSSEASQLRYQLDRPKELTGAGSARALKVRISAMSKRRLRVKQTMSLQKRLLTFAGYARDAAEDLPLGPRKQQMLEKAREAETTANLDQWISSPGLAPPE